MTARLALLSLAVTMAVGTGCAPATEPSSTDADLVGGKEAGLSLPSTVHVFGRCTAAKVGERHLLIAAHCVDDPEHLGEGKLSMQFDRGALLSISNAPKGDGEQEYLRVLVEQTFIHPSWKGVLDVSLMKGLETAHDVAVIVLAKSEAEVIAEIPIATIDPTPVKVGDALIITGFGCEKGAHEAPSTSPRLKAQRTMAVSTEETLPGTTADGQADFAKVDANYLTTPGKAKDTKNASICPGDSGGPVYRADGTHGIVGVNSVFAPGGSGVGKGIAYANLHARIDDESRDHVATWLSEILAR